MGRRRKGFMNQSKITPNIVGNRDQIRRREGGTDRHRRKLERALRVRNHLGRSGRPVTLAVFTYNFDLL